MNTNKCCFALDLKEDDGMISEYEYYHQPDVIWPEIVNGIKECNILNLEIYRVGNRLLMILETDESFDLGRDFKHMLTLPRQKEWSDLMATFQQRLPFAKENEHWILMQKIFDLNA